MILRNSKLRLCAAALLCVVLVGISAGLARAYYWTIDGTVSAQFTANDRRTVGINTNANLPVNFTPSVVFTNGSGAGQAAILYQASAALSGGTLDLDLNGVLKDSYGSTMNLVRVKAIAIQNTSTHTLTVGAAGSNPWATLLGATSTLTLPAGGWFVAATPDATGWTVTASTGDILEINGTGTDTFTLVILGSAS